MQPIRSRSKHCACFTQPTIGSNLRVPTSGRIVPRMTSLRQGTQGYSDEARLWQVLGMALLAGGGVPLGLNIVHVAFVGRMEADALQLGIGYSAIMLLGFSSLVLSRVLTAKVGIQHEHLDWIWTVLAWVAMPLGAASFDLEWSQLALAPATPEQVAMLAACAFVFLVGVISLFGEHAVNRIQSSAIRRSLNDVRGRDPEPQADSRR